MTSVVHQLKKGLKPRKLHYYEMETFKERLRSKYRESQTSIAFIQNAQTVFTDKKMDDINGKYLIMTKISSF